MPPCSSVAVSVRHCSPQGLWCGRGIRYWNCIHLCFVRPWMYLMTIPLFQYVFRLSVRKVSVCCPDYNIRWYRRNGAWLSLLPKIRPHSVTLWWRAIRLSVRDWKNGFLSYIIFFVFLHVFQFLTLTFQPLGFLQYALLLPFTFNMTCRFSMYRSCAALRSGGQTKWGLRKSLPNLSNRYTRSHHITMSDMSYLLRMAIL